MTKLIYILPFITFGQTWNFDSSYKLPKNLSVTIDSLIGNGHILYLQCGSSLTVINHIENVKLYVMRDDNELCLDTNNVYVFRTTTANNVAIGECTNLERLKYNPNKIKKKQ